MNKEDRGLYVVMFLAIPFLVAGAFWLSPWIGIPTLLLGVVFWLGILLIFGEEAKKKDGRKTADVVNNVTYHFGGTHEERMERIRDAAARAGKSMQSNT